MILIIHTDHTDENTIQRLCDKMNQSNGNEILNSFLRQQLLVGLDFASLRFCEQVWTMVLRPS